MDGLEKQTTPSQTEKLGTPMSAETEEPWAPYKEISRKRKRKVHFYGHLVPWIIYLEFLPHIISGPSKKKERKNIHNHKN
jgi:hypothetical protein